MPWPSSHRATCKLAPHLSSPPQSPWDSESWAPYGGPIQGLPGEPGGARAHRGRGAGESGTVRAGVLKEGREGHGEEAPALPRRAPL